MPLPAWWPKRLSPMKSCVDACSRSMQNGERHLQRRRKRAEHWDPLFFVVCTEWRLVQKTPACSVDPRDSYWVRPLTADKVYRDCWPSVCSYNANCLCKLCAAGTAQRTTVLWSAQQCILLLHSCGLFCWYSTRSSMLSTLETRSKSTTVILVLIRCDDTRSCRCWLWWGEC